MYDGQVQAAIVSFGLFISRGDMMGLHHLLALQGFEVDIESPEAMQVLEDFIG
jgi:hypothetical protein